jgi:hypothetical protein
LVDDFGENLLAGEDRQLQTVNLGLDADFAARVMGVLGQFVELLFPDVGNDLCDCLRLGVFGAVLKIFLDFEAQLQVCLFVGVIFIELVESHFQIVI